MKKYPWLWASLLVVAAVACLWGRRWAGAATLTAEERAQMQGGGINLCVGTISTCHDPTQPTTCA